jgi:ElaB/YqjD/DUF883 family membrane-anchored ribosome-binding protein
MPGPNGFENHATADSLGASIKQLIDRVMTKPAEPTRFGKLVTRAEELIKTHPIAALGIALGVGYAIVRIARRR